MQGSTKAENKSNKVPKKKRRQQEKRYKTEFDKKCAKHGIDFSKGFTPAVISAINMLNLEYLAIAAARSIGVLGIVLSLDVLSRNLEHRERYIKLLQDTKAECDSAMKQYLNSSRNIKSTKARIKYLSAMIRIFVPAVSHAGNLMNNWATCVPEAITDDWLSARDLCDLAITLPRLY